MSENFSLKSSENCQIDVTAFGSSNLENGNCIVFVHGFKGFKDWGFGPYLGNYLADKGFFVITFNFSHNGVGSGSIEFDEPEKFSSNTYSREISELNDIINSYKNGYFGRINKNNKIGILGHSRGGGISIIAASINKNISAVATWSSISKFDRWSKRQKNEWREKGYFEILNSRTKQMMKLSTELLDDIENNSADFLNLEKALKKIEIPFLIVHGDQDLAVPVDEAEKIYSWSDPGKTEFFKISGTGHTFDIKHPFEGVSRAFEKVLEKTNHFFQKSFNG